MIKCSQIDIGDMLIINVFTEKSYHPKPTNNIIVENKNVRAV